MSTPIKQVEYLIKADSKLARGVPCTIKTEIAVNMNSSNFSINIKCHRCVASTLKDKFAAAVATARLIKKFISDWRIFGQHESVRIFFPIW